MHTIYLIAGMPGTGKTTFSTHFARQRHIPLFCKDAMKELLFDTVGFASPAAKQKLDVASTQLLYYAAAAQMQTGGDVMIESNFTRADVPDVQALCDRYGYRPVTVLFDGDLDAVFERVCRRDLSPDRHPAHAIPDCYPAPGGQKKKPDAPLMQRDQFFDMVESWGSREFCVGRRLVVDATDLDKLDFARIAAQIDELEDC